MSGYSEKVTAAFPVLTHSQKTAADYVLSHMDVMAFTTLDEAAMKIGVSTTTIIRFARMLGYNGYSDMQKDIQGEIIDKVSLPDRFNASSDFISSNKLIAETMQNDIANITNTISTLPHEVLQQVVTEIINAKHIYIVGMRSSFALAHYTMSRLGQIRPHVHLVQSAGMLFPEEMVGHSSGDLYIAFMFPRYSKTTANLITWLRKIKIHGILFTGPNYTLVQNYGDIILPCHVKSNSFKNSFAAPICVINYIAAATALENKPRAIETLRQTEEFLNKGYYLGL